MNEVDKRLAEIRERVEKAHFHKAGDDLRYLLDLVAGLRAHDADMSSARQKWQRVAEAAETKIADLRRQLVDHDSEASATCQDWDIKCQELEQQLAEAEVLVPEPDVLEWMIEIVYQETLFWPDQDEKDRAAKMIDAVRQQIIAIRAWREGQGQEQEQADG